MLIANATDADTNDDDIDFFLMVLNVEQQMEL